MNDVERFRTYFSDEINPLANFTWERDGKLKENEYFRFGWMEGSSSDDYTMAGTWTVGGEWVDMLPGPSKIKSRDVAGEEMITPARAEIDMRYEMYCDWLYIGSHGTLVYESYFCSYFRPRTPAALMDWISNVVSGRCTIHSHRFRPLQHRRSADICLTRYFPSTRIFASSSKRLHSCTVPCELPVKGWIGLIALA